MARGGEVSPRGRVVLDVPAMVDWVSRASAGDAVVYARGDAPPKRSAAVANRLHEEGLIDLTRRRDATGRFQFIAQRRTTPFARIAARTRRFSRASAETTILRMIREAIRHGRPCPTNAEFAEAAGLSGRLAASYRLRRLVAAGTIALIDHGPFEHRVAVLVESGQATVRARL